MLMLNRRSMMREFTVGLLWIASSLLLSASIAGAGTILPGQYQLLDHPDGGISPPPYGLRVDDLGLTFST